MKTVERLDRIEANLERLTETGAAAGAQIVALGARIEALGARIEALGSRIDTLVQAVSTIAASVAAHDEQIEKLLIISEKHAASIRSLADAVENQRKEWEAYINTRTRQ